MITSIQGTLTEATPLRAVIELNGFGYEVNIPVTTAEKLPLNGTIIKLHTHVIYREDAQTLYGFASAAERDFFRMMIEQVTGIGPKSALNIMSNASLSLLEATIRNGDVGTLAKCPGIGKKTAERLVVELKNKVGGVSTSVSPGPETSTGETAGASRHRDAVLALTTLGYKAATADEAVRRAALALGAAASTEDLIKKSLN